MTLTAASHWGVASLPASGDGSRGGTSREMDGECSARQQSPSHRERIPPPRAGPLVASPPCLWVRWHRLGIIRSSRSSDDSIRLQRPWTQTPATPGGRRVAGATAGSPEDRSSGPEADSVRPRQGRMHVPPLPGAFGLQWMVVQHPAPASGVCSPACCLHCLVPSNFGGRWSGILTPHPASTVPPGA